MSSDLSQVPTSNLFIPIVSSPSGGTPPPDPRPEAPGSPESALFSADRSRPAPVPLDAPRVAPKIVWPKPIPPAATPRNYEEYLHFPVTHVTPLDFLSNKGNAQRIVTRAAAMYLAQFKSLKPVEEGEVFPLEARYFTQLALDIYKANGDVHLFALNTKADYAVWMRTAATGFVRKLFLPTTKLLDFEPGNLATFDCELLSVSKEEFPFSLMSIDALYRLFFLDLALSRYVYLYAKDIRAERIAFTPEEVSFMEEFDYFSFVAFITYTGSLLLLAAESYSRVLYEGVRWMLIRAYCALGILSWNTVKGFDSVDLPNYERVFDGSLSPSTRFSPAETYGDSYAQYGWKLFEKRPSANYHLASMTQIAFFNNYRFRPEDDTELQIKLQTGCLNVGCVPYKPSSLARPISDNRYPKKELRSFRAEEYREGRVFYPIVADNSTSDVAHEWYFLFDILNVFGHLNLKPFHAQQKKKADLSLSTKDDRSVCLSLNFPTPVKFGITWTKDGLSYRFDWAQYLSLRYSMTFNRLILDTIPREINTEILKSDQNDPNSYLSLLMHRRELAASINASIKNNVDPEVLTEIQRDILDILDYTQQRLENVFNSICVASMRSVLAFESYCSISTTVEDVTQQNLSKPWEFYVVQEELKKSALSIRKELLLKGLIPTELVKKKSKKPIDNSSKVSEPKVYLTRPAGRYPDAFFFVIGTSSYGYQTMIVTAIKTEPYAAFSGPISNILLGLKETHPDLFVDAKTYSVYPYTFLPLELLCGANPVRSTLDLVLNTAAVINIYGLLRREDCVRADIISAICKTGITPPSFKDHFGSANPIEYLELCRTFQMSPEIVDKIAAIYSIPVSVKLSRTSLEEYTTIMKTHADPFEALCRYAPGRVHEYSPRFTDSDDLFIRKFFAPDMTQGDKNLLLKHCNGHTWKSIEARARVLTLKMLIEERVFNINLLPVRNYTAKTKELLERNFQAALNVDPRLKVDDNKRTEAALRKKYLTPRPRRPL